MVDNVYQKFIEWCGFMVVIFLFLGVGKFIILCNLLEIDCNFLFFVLVMMCVKCGSEIEGIYYYFKSQCEFELMCDGEVFFEWVFVYGNYYGMLCFEVEKVMVEGCDMFFDIDWQGVQ